MQLVRVRSKAHNQILKKTDEYSNADVYREIKAALTEMANFNSQIISVQHIQIFCS